ncbi:hypothetical protein CBR_g67862, partial [Chara braunii]
EEIQPSAGKRRE